MLIWRSFLGSLQLASSVIRFSGRLLAIVRNFEMRLRCRFSLDAAERQVSSGWVSMNSLTRIASSTKFLGGALLGMISGSARPIEACKTP